MPQIKPGKMKVTHEKLWQKSKKSENKNGSSQTWLLLCTSSVPCSSLVTFTLSDTGPTANLLFNIIFSLLTIALLPPAVLAQQDSTAQATTDTLTSTLESLVVEAIRSTVSPVDAPLSFSIKTRTFDERKATATTSLASLTQSLPGIWVSNRHNNALGDRITIRGIGWRASYGVRGIQIVLNGIPLTVADGSSVTNIIDPGLVTRIELIRGPASSYWGNSSGGVLYISTEPDYSRKNNFYVRLYGGSYQHRKAEFRFVESFGNHNISAYASYHSIEGYRNYNASKVLRSGFQGRYQFKSGANLAYTGALIWMPLAQHPSGLSAEQVEENPRQANESFIISESGQQTFQSQLGLKYTQNTALGFLTISGYGAYRDIANPLPFAIITVERFTGGVRGAIEKDFDILTIQFGGEIKFQLDDRIEYENNRGERDAVKVNQVEEVWNQALFVTADYTFGSLTLLGSLRYDQITFSADASMTNRTGKRTFQSLSPGFGISYDLESIILYSNVSTSFQAPTTTELVNQPGGGNGFNPNLEPMHTVGLELGTRGQKLNSKLVYDIALYRMWIKNLIFPYQLSANGPTFYRNQGQTRHQGIEVSATFRPENNISLQTAYTLTDAEFIEAQIDSLSLNSIAVPGIARHRLWAAASWSPGTFWMQLDGQFVSSYPVNNLNTYYNDSYITVDFKMSYEFAFNNSGVIMTPFININNLFDVQYSSSVVVNAFGGRYYEPAPGRTWQAGVSFRF